MQGIKNHRELGNMTQTKETNKDPKTEPKEMGDL